LKKHAEAIAAYDHFLVQTERPSERASAYLDRGVAQLCLRDFEAARNSAQESLRSQKEGRTNAEARLLLGDISAANGNLEEAAKEYLVVSQIFMDPEITPKALTKAINAYRTLGNQEKATELTQELGAGYPDYRAPASLDHEC
jgi:TolA-binding protein